MKIIKLDDSGTDAALLGIGLSYGKTLTVAKDFNLVLSWIDGEGYSNLTQALMETKAQMDNRADSLAHKGGGHNEFLKHITVQFLITAPNFWWKHIDQYKVGFVDMSTSQMHNILDRDLEMGDFEYDIPEPFINLLSHFRKLVVAGQFELEKYINMIPEGYLYTRVVTTNYMTLQNIIKQRKNHKLSQWRYFCTEVLRLIEHPYWLVEK
jgi:hypothetical protein